MGTFYHSEVSTVMFMFIAVATILIPHLMKPMDTLIRHNILAVNR